MKQIAVYVTAKVQVGSNRTTNLTQAQKLSEEARRNKAKVLDCALSIEDILARILSHYFFGAKHEKKKNFESMILNSDWCSFSAKRKLINHLLDEQPLLKGEKRTEFDKLMRRVMSLRNAFAHGTFTCTDTTVWLSYFEGTPHQQELTDMYLTEVEDVLLKAANAVVSLESRVIEYKEEGGGEVPTTIVPPEKSPGD